MKQYLVYKLNISDGTVYYGITRSVAYRLQAHIILYKKGGLTVDMQVIEDCLTEFEAMTIETALINSNKCRNIARQTVQIKGPIVQKARKITSLTAEEILELYGDIE